MRVGPFRLFFFSHEGEEDAHIHVERERKIAKFWLNPVGLASAQGFSPYELRLIERSVVDNEGQLLEAWNEFFGC